jgi:Rieske Fe-S protein
MVPTSDQSEPTPTTEAPSHPDGGTPALARPNRRTLLRSAGLTAVVGGAAFGLVGCAAEETPAAPAGSEAAPSSSAPAPSTPVSSKAAASGTTVATADVPVGSGIILDNAAYVVTQPTEGEFKAFSKKCTHMGCAVARVESKEIACPCHGSRFSISDGSVTNGPADEPLKEFEVSVSGDQLTIAS